MFLLNGNVRRHFCIVWLTSLTHCSIVENWSSPWGVVFEQISGCFVDAIVCMIIPH